MESLVWHDPELAVTIFNALLYVAGVAIVGAALSALARPPSDPARDPRRPELDGGERHEP